MRNSSSSSSLSLLKSFSVLFNSARLTPSIKQDTASAKTFFLYCILFCKGKKHQTLLFFFFPNSASYFLIFDSLTSQSLRLAARWLPPEERERAIWWRREGYHDSLPVGSPHRLTGFSDRTMCFCASVHPAAWEFVRACVQSSRDEIVPELPVKRVRSKAPCGKHSLWGKLRLCKYTRGAGRQTDWQKRQADRQADSSVVDSPVRKTWLS